MEIDGQVTISLKTFNQLQDRAKQADELKKRMRDLQEKITDIIDQIDETEAEPIFREIDDSNMTDKQIQKRFDEAIAKFRIILDPEKTKRFCDACEWCRWYDGDTKNPDKWKQECDEYIITEEQAKRNRKKFKIVK